MNSSTPLRVLFLGKDAKRGGMQNELLNNVQFLDKTRFSAHVLLQAGGELLPLYRQHAPTEVFAEQAQAQSPRQLPPRVKRWLPDGVLDRVAGGHITDAWAMDIASRFNPEIIVRQYMQPSPIFHSLENSATPTVQSFLMAGAQTERLSDENLRWLSQPFIVYPGTGVRQFLERSLGVETAPEREICTGINLEVLEQQISQPNRVRRADLGFAEDDIVIGTCGLIVFLKGVDLWVEAAAILRERYPQKSLKFLWIGGSETHLQSTYGQSIQRLIAKRGLQDHVVITGHQSQVYHYHDLCDIYVQSSRDDAFPLATCEAMALGKPVVAFPQGVALEEYSRHALVRVDEVQPHTLADGIASLINSPDERQKLGAAARQVIVERLEINKSVRRYEEVLLQLARGPKASAAA